MSEKQAIVVSLALLALAGYFVWFGPIFFVGLPLGLAWPIAEKNVKQKPILSLIFLLTILIFTVLSIVVAYAYFYVDLGNSLILGVLAGAAVATLLYTRLRKLTNNQPA